MAVIGLPQQFHRRAAAVWRLMPKNIGDPASTGGNETILKGFPRWSARLSLKVGPGPEKAEWQAFLDQLDGRANTVELAPWPCMPRGVESAFGWPESPDQVLHSDNTPHDDGTGYEQGPMTVASAESVAPFAFSVLVEHGLLQPAGWRVGHYFSFGGRLRRVSGIFDVSGSRCRLAFSPAAMLTIPAGSPIVLGGTAVMRLTEEAAGTLSNDLGASNIVELDFLEFLR